MFSTTTLDGDNTQWEMEGENTIGNVVINMIETREYDGLVAVATHGNGIYASRFHPALAVEDHSFELVELMQNVPNPFQHSTAIKINLSENGMTRLQVFSSNGQLVKTVVNEHLLRGKHLLKWDGTDESATPVSSGIYLAVLESGTQRQTISMLLMR